MKTKTTKMKSANRNREILRKITWLFVLGVFLNATFSAFAQNPTPTPEKRRAPDIQLLPIGASIEKEVAAEKYETFFVELKKGEFLTVEAQSDKLDVFLLIGTIDEKLLKNSNFTGDAGKEILLFESPADAVFLVLAGSYSPEKGKLTLNARTEKTISLTSAKRLKAETSMLDAQQIPRDALAERQRIIEKGDGLTSEDLKTLKELPETAGQKSAAAWLAASAIWRELGDKFWEAVCLHRAGFKYFELGKTDAALKNYLPALALQKEIGDRRGEAQSLHDAAKVYLDTGNPTKALEIFGQALAVTKLTGNRPFEAHLLTDLGTTNDEIGNVELAIRFHRDSLVISRDIGDKEAMSLALNNIGTIFIKTGEALQAIQSFEEALKLAEVINDKAVIGQITQNFGAVFDYLKEYEKALDYYSKANVLFGEVGFTERQVQTVKKVADLFAKTGDYESALINYERSLAYFKDSNDVSSQAYTLSNIAFAYSGLGNRQKAFEIWQQALGMFQKLGDRSGEASMLANLGNYYANAGDKQKALEHYTRSLPLRRAVRDREGEASTLSELMEFFAVLDKNLRLAVFYGKQSVNLSQELRGNTQGFAGESQRQFLKGKEQVYRYLAEILLQQGRTSEAQQVLNAFKDQQVFDFDRAAKQPAKLALTPREADFSARYLQQSERVGTLGGQLNDVRRQAGNSPSAEQSAQIIKLEAELKAASDDFSAVLNQAKIEFSQPPNEKDKIGEVFDTMQMQATLRELSQKTGQKAVAVYQFIGQENFRAIIITPDKITDISTPIKSDALNEKALKLWALLQSDKYDTTVLSKQIYDAVFKPLELQLPKDTTTIMWAMDGNLRYVPMAALFDGNKFLAEKYNHVVFTRADQERMTRNVQTVWTGLGFGSSNAATVDVLGDKISFNALPGVSEELTAIFKNTKGILNGDVLSDAKFSRKSFLNALKQKRPLVHIASHFSFRAGDESRSFLLMGDGTAFTLEEMKQEKDLFQGVELLTLSACNTAAQQSGNGREIDGFAELAQRLGAGAVMATLWQVSDASTPWLMRDFYATRQSKAGMTKAEALRQAQLALLNGTAQTKPLPNTEKGAGSKINIEIVPKGTRRDGNQTRTGVVKIEESDAPLYKKNGKPPFAHPYYWSPFILIGNWR